MGRAFGITALIIGIISIPVSLLMAALSGWSYILPGNFPIISIIGWLIPGIAIIFGIIGIIADHPKGMAIAGIILGIIGLIIGFLIRSFFASLFVP